jgi:hypothetical protein
VPLVDDDLGERGDHPMAAVLAEHQGLEPAADAQLDDDAVQRSSHPARGPELRELRGLGETPPHQLGIRR